MLFILVANFRFQIGYTRPYAKNGYLAGQIARRFINILQQMMAQLLLGKHVEN